MATDTANALEHWLKIGGLTITLAGLLVGTYQFTRNQAVEAARPFLERKLKWCEEAVEVAAGIAVHGRESVLAPVVSGTTGKRVDRFWAMYWGVMGMVEAQEITDAMIDFGKGLKTEAAESDGKRALAIAHACRSEMARCWSPAWRRD
jgi:hypothetical protein